MLTGFRASKSGGDRRAPPVRVHLSVCVAKKNFWSALTHGKQTRHPSFHANKQFGGLQKLAWIKKNGNSPMHISWFVMGLAGLVALRWLWEYENCTREIKRKLKNLEDEQHFLGERVGVIEREMWRLSKALDRKQERQETIEEQLLRENCHPPA